jgi:hypothetical protein
MTTALLSYTTSRDTTKLGNGVVTSELIGPSVGARERDRLAHGLGRFLFRGDGVNGAAD